MVEVIKEVLQLAVRAIIKVGWRKILTRAMLEAKGTRVVTKLLEKGKIFQIC